MSFKPRIHLGHRTLRLSHCVHRRRCFTSPSTPPSNDTPLQKLRSNVHHHFQHSIRPPFIQLRSDLLRRSNDALSSAARHATLLGLKLNEVTGYEQVERLKTLVSDQEKTLSDARDHARSAKTAYDQAVAHRSTSQRDVNSLLERKHSWTDADVSAFTTLVRTDHASTAAVATTSLDLKEKELAVDKAFTDLTSAILQRYHEEQVWSDKIRSVSTWANVVGLVFNFLIFMIAIAIVEPWKRRRLVERVEERMTTMVDRLDGKVQDVARLLQEELARGVVEVEEKVELPLPTVVSSPAMDPISSRLSYLLGREITLSPEQTHAAVGIAGAVVGTSVVALISALIK